MSPVLAALRSMRGTCGATGSEGEAGGDKDGATGGDEDATAKGGEVSNCFLARRAFLLSFRACNRCNSCSCCAAKEERVLGLRLSVSP